MKIAFFEVHEWEKELLRKTFIKDKTFFSKHPIGESDISAMKDSEVISVFIYSQVTPAILDRFPKLKLIVTRSTGFDHIDVAECTQRGITVCNVPFYGENTVAEHAFALLLALSRKVHHSYLRTVSNDFSITGLEGFDLKGKTLGVIGTGRIGQHTIRIARGFEMKVIAFDRYPNKKLARSLDFSYVSLDALFKQSDVLTLHIPSTKENYHLINATSLKRMKKGAFIINTARGDLIDTTALLSAIERGHIGGAGLDVIEGERLITEENELIHLNHVQLKQIVEDHALLHNERVVFTPHIAFFSREALLRIVHTTIDTITRFKKKKVINQVHV